MNSLEAAQEKASCCIATEPATAKCGCATETGNVLCYAGAYASVWRTFAVEMAPRTAKQH